eukprot:CAMPEP_0206615610 /NCGR_PEP_ID=MMETSP0325_2-20121206/58361_1 /ASSEMBLY_ACC=CAM_ASM_000347 /TAXON_ID=2866 /ORGANISM="Crypthecodinium cohnii, Strain Seligo" /LENGTH=44 /DNA_ID= /DNA_START= /DNA_END= /DNA_ORIENTATION=
MALPQPLSTYVALSSVLMQCHTSPAMRQMTAGNVASDPIFNASM